MLETTTLPGLHDFVVDRVLRRFAHPGERAIDLGGGSGALAVRLRELGWDVRAVETNAQDYKADVPLVRLDLNQPDFAAQLGEGMYGLAIAVEVLEHMESPIGFLRNVGRLLMSDGIAVLTTPNVDNVPARLKFLLTGKLRMMDERGEPTHISPVFWDLFVRQYLPRARVQLMEHLLYPPDGYKNTRLFYSRVLGTLARFLPGECLLGDIHVLVVRSQR